MRRRHVTRAIVVVALALAVYTLERFAFEQRSTPERAIVTRLEGVSERCGTRLSRHDCTRFFAVARYRVAGETYELRVDAGTASGHDVVAEAAAFSIGDEIQLVVDPSRPERAYPHSRLEIYLGPVVVAIVLLMLVLGRRHVRLP